MSDVDAMREWAMNQWIARYSPSELSVAGANVGGMTADVVFDHLRKYADALTPREGLTAPEISHGAVVMMMSPSSLHELNARRLRLQLDSQVPGTDPGFIAETGPGVLDPQHGILRYPDLVVVREEALETMAEGVDPAEVLLAAEIVSPSNPENDYIGKLRDYPAMGIRDYLLVDPREGVVIHHFGPERGAYANTLKYTFGDVIEIDDWTLDTSKFVHYSDR